jgi:hypothetical protein
LAERGLEPEVCFFCVAEVIVEFFGHDLAPDGAGDGVAESGADVVGCEVDTGYNGDVCMQLAASSLFFMREGWRGNVRSCWVAAWMLAWAG